MGGLVSRWFIEREGGNQVVQHLVMLGTPNAGSPWPAVQDWAFTALGVGLNQLSAIVWPTKVVADLLTFLEANDNSLDQMQPDSPFIKAIADSPDPSIPYTIIAGDRSILPAALQLQPEKQSSHLQRLVQKLFGGAVDKVVNLVFFKQPNDIAVTLASIKSVSSDRSPQPRILLPDSACDHLTYFTHQGGLEALAIALGEDLVIVSPPSQSSDQIHPLPQVTIPQDTTSPAASSTTPEQVNTMASTPDFDAVASVPKPEPNPVSASTHPPSAEPIEPDNAEQDVENRSGLNGTVVGVITLLVALAVIGLVVWKRSPKQEPQPQNTTSQPLPGEIKTSHGLH
jgi:hypothetical protein